jgi:hypothetical protein
MNSSQSFSALFCRRTQLALLPEMLTRYPRSASAIDVLYRSNLRFQRAIILYTKSALQMFAPLTEAPRANLPSRKHGVNI